MDEIQLRAGPWEDDEEAKYRGYLMSCYQLTREYEDFSAALVAKLASLGPVGRRSLLDYLQQTLSVKTTKKRLRNSQIQPPNNFDGNKEYRRFVGLLADRLKALETVDGRILLDRLRTIIESYDGRAVWFPAETMNGQRYPEKQVFGLQAILSEMRLRNGRPWKDNEESEMREHLVKHLPKEENGLIPAAPPYAKITPEPESIHG